MLFEMLWPCFENRVVQTCWLQLSLHVIASALEHMFAWEGDFEYFSLIQCGHETYSAFSLPISVDRNNNVISFYLFLFVCDRMDHSILYLMGFCYYLSNHHRMQILPKLPRNNRKLKRNAITSLHFLVHLSPQTKQH